jgi:phenylacetate-CoA ligase
MKKYELSELLSYAYQFSPYYRKTLKDSKLKDLEDVPIIHQEEFWKSSILTSTTPKGIVFKSGGSSGAPKFSYFTHEEWKTFTDYFGWGISEGIIENDDRVANLFYVGDMYASFLFIKDSLQTLNLITQFPIAGSTIHRSILNTIEEFNINVLCGVPSQILKLLEFYDEDRSLYKNIKIKKILFGGESLYPDQEEAIKEIFPDIKVSSVGLASVDGGLLGYTSMDCKNGEHRVFDGATIVEIVDEETSQLISDEGRIGKVVLTNLTRKLMPIIRYPAGDRAMWVEMKGTPNRKFKLCGRAEDGARVGTITVYFESTRDLITKTLSEFSGIQFQMVLNHYDNLDELVFKIAAHDLIATESIKAKVLEAFIRDKEVYSEVLNKKMIHPLKIELVSMKDLESNQRTGKMKRIIDNRF